MSNEVAPVVGPYKLLRLRDRLYVEAEKGGFVCDTQYDACETDEERAQCLATARLLVAAPTLYTALKALVALLEEHEDIEHEYFGCPSDEVENCPMCAARRALDSVQYDKQ